MKMIISEVIGPLKQDSSFPDWWESEPIPIPLLDQAKLGITFMDFEPDQDTAFMREADQALTNFLKLDEAYKVEITDHVYQNCMDFLAAVGPDDADDALRQMQEKKEIWHFVHPNQIYVTRRPSREQDIYVFIACNCDWEQEHGLQLVFRQGKKLTRVSDQDGHVTEADAYGKPEDELLSGF